MSEPLQSLADLIEAEAIDEETVAALAVPSSGVPLYAHHGCRPRPAFALYDTRTREDFTHSWTTDDELAVMRRAVQAIADALTPPPPPERRVTPLEFFNLFTVPEQVAIFGSAIGEVKMLTARASAATFVDLDNAEVAYGVNYLETAGLIGEGRAAQVIAGDAP